MQLPYFSPNWVEAAEPIWEGSLEESSSATLLGIGVSSVLPGVDRNCHWMKRAPQTCRTVVVCGVCGCFIHGSVFLCFGSISQRRQDEIGWLVLFTSLSFVSGEFCCPERTAFVLCHQVAHSSKWHITYQAPTIFCFLPTSYFLLCSKCAISSMKHCSEMKMRLTVWPYMPPLRATIYGSHFLSSQSWRSKRCKCQSVSP